MSVFEFRTTWFRKNKETIYVNNIIFCELFYASRDYLRKKFDSSPYGPSIPALKEKGQWWEEARVCLPSWHNIWEDSRRWSLKLLVHFPRGLMTNDRSCLSSNGVDAILKKCHSKLISLERLGNRRYQLLSAWYSNPVSISRVTTNVWFISIDHYSHVWHEFLKSSAIQHIIWVILTLLISSLKVNDIFLKSSKHQDLKYSRFNNVCLARLHLLITLTYYCIFFSVESWHVLISPIKINWLITFLKPRVVLQISSNTLPFVFRDSQNTHSLFRKFSTLFLSLQLFTISKRSCSGN